MPSVPAGHAVRPHPRSLARLYGWLPRGRTLPHDAWRSRHRWLLALLWLHVPGLVAFGLAQGYGAAYAVEHVALVAAFAAAATVSLSHRRLSSSAVAIGLLSASAAATHLSGGYIEAHFHFFVVVALLVLYEDWLPFLIAISYVGVHHGLVGALEPGHVFNHADGNARPWKWAGIHAAFIAALSVGSVVSWRFNERTRAQARASEDRFRSAFEDAPIGMALLDPRTEAFGSFLRVNRALCEMLGYSEQELLARDFQSITHPEDLDRNLAEARAFASGEQDGYEIEKRYVHAEGHAIWALVHSSLIHDDAGRPVLCISQVQDVTERKRIEAVLSHRALHDTLTGLANRALFVDRLGHALAQLERRPGEIAVLFLDLDNFKLVNDTFGHAVGDEVLRALATRIQATVRAGDTVARFGGDEFAVLCGDVEGGSRAVEIAERLGTALAEPITAHGTTLVLTTSIGIVVERDPRRDPANLLRDADAAMYRAKSGGPGGYQIFHEELRARIVKRLETEHALREAIDAGQIGLVYQPIVDLETEQVVMVEALARWRHPELGTIAPAEFIPIAEETGLIQQLGERLLAEACAEAARWPGTAGRPAPKVAVNISPRQLAAPEFVATVERALDRAGLAPQRLSLEITETAMLDGKRAAETMERLERLGVETALDDFGAGYSSFGQLREMPPLDVLKIDRSFIAGLEGDSNARALVTAVASMARTLGVRAVAEGLETEEQVAIVRALGCPLGQGFHFARPQPGEAIRALLAEQASAALAER